MRSSCAAEACLARQQLVQFPLAFDPQALLSGNILKFPPTSGVFFTHATSATHPLLLQPAMMQQQQQQPEDRQNGLPIMQQQLQLEQSLSPSFREPAGLQLYRLQQQQQLATGCLPMQLLQQQPTSLTYQQLEWAAAAAAGGGGAKEMTARLYQAAALPQRSGQQDWVAAGAGAGEMTAQQGQCQAAARPTLGVSPHWMIPGSMGTVGIHEVDVAAAGAAMHTHHLDEDTAAGAAMRTHHIDDVSESNVSRAQDATSDGGGGRRAVADACGKQPHLGQGDGVRSNGSDLISVKDECGSGLLIRVKHECEQGEEAKQQLEEATQQLRQPAGQRVSKSTPPKRVCGRKRRAASPLAEDGGSTGGSTGGGGMGEDDTKERNRQAQHRFRERQKQSIGALREEVSERRTV